MASWAGPRTVLFPTRGAGGLPCTLGNGGPSSSRGPASASPSTAKTAKEELPWQLFFSLQSLLSFFSFLPVSLLQISAQSLPEKIEFNTYNQKFKIVTSLLFLILRLPIFKAPFNLTSSLFISPSYFNLSSFCF